MSKRRRAKASSEVSTSGTGIVRGRFRRTSATPGASSGSNGSGARSAKLLGLLALAVAGLFAFTATPALAAAPTPTIDPAPTAAYTTAQVSGTLDPADQEAVYYTFEYSADPATEGWSSFTYEGSVTPGGGAQNVSAQLSYLKPGTEYHVRLAAIGFPEEVEVFSAGPDPTFTTKAVTAPSVSLDPIVTFTGSTAHFSGTVETNAPAGPLSPAAEAAYQAKWEFQCNPGCPGISGGVIEASEASHTVTADPTGLEPNTHYEVTLVAHNAGGEGTEVKNFNTSLIAATVNGGPGVSGGNGDYTLQGAVNPHNSAVSTCAFEVGATAGYGQTIPCNLKPGVVNKPVEVTAHLTGLTLGATYHFQIKVKTGAGTSTSADGVFVPTAASAAAACPNEGLRQENNSLKLPDCRAYEQVSPVDKQGVRGFGGGVTSDGNHAIFLSDGAFAGAPRGGANPYLGTRTSTGWRTNWLQPALPSFLTSSLIGFTVSTVSADASRMLMQGDPLDPSMSGGNGTGGNGNLYIREANGHMTWVSPIEPGIPPAFVASIVEPAATPDLSHVVFPDSQRLLNGAAEGLDANASGLYEWTDGALRLVNVDSSGALVSPYGATLGGEVNKVHALSRDGERIYFSTPNDVFPQPPPAGIRRIYLRQSGQTTTEISATQCTEPSCEGPEEDAVYQGASADGSVAFFTSKAQLTNTATKGGGLYRYDVGSGKLTLLTPDATDPGGPGVTGEVANSDDGSIVYFIATGVLAEGGTAGAANLYVYDANTSSTHFIAPFPRDGTGRQIGEATPSGRYFVFQTAGPNASGYDNAGHTEIYRYDEATKAAPICLTCLPPGEPASGDSTFQAGGTSANNNITDDGSRVFFQSNVALVPGDSNGKIDIYQWHEGTLSLISSGTGSADSLYSSATSSGSDVLFNTYDRLVPEDTDEQMDVYDARIDGGFPAPPTPSPTCTGPGCRSTAGGAPPLTGVGSTTFSGKGNSAPAGKQDQCAQKTRKAKKQRQQAKRARNQAGKAKNPKQARQLRQKAKRLESKAAKSAKGCTKKNGSGKTSGRTINQDRRGNR